MDSSGLTSLLTITDCYNVYFDPPLGITAYVMLLPSGSVTWEACVWLQYEQHLIVHTYIPDCDPLMIISWSVLQLSVYEPIYI